MSSLKTMLLVVLVVTALFIYVFIRYNVLGSSHDSHHYRTINDYLFKKMETSGQKLSMEILVNPAKYPVISDANNFQEENEKENNSKRSPEIRDHWKQVTKRIYIYSAYQELRSQRNGCLIRILAVGYRKELVGLRLRCFLKYNNTTNSEGIYSGFRRIKEKYLSAYSSVFFLCNSLNSTLPSDIAVQVLGSNDTIQWLTVHKTAQMEAKKQAISICVKPFQENDFDLKLLAEFLAYYSAAEITSVTFYNYSVNETMLSYLKAVSSQKMKIRLLNWNFPAAVVKATGHYGRLASIQDCLLRSVTITNYVLLVDVDQFLVPRRHFTINELMEDLSSSAKRKIGSFIFRRIHFCNTKPHSSVDHFSLVTSDWVHREDDFQPREKKNNILVRPETVLESDFYEVLIHTDGWEEAAVPWELAMVHHYSYKWCKIHAEKVTTLDETAVPMKYEIIYSKPMEKWREISKI